MTTRFERFLCKINRACHGGCWEWTAATHGTGPYGAFWDGTKLVQAHRWAYEFFMGKIPDGLTIDHLCRNTVCVNPGHLEPVTHRENNLRGGSMSAIHATKTHCIAGHPFDEKNTRITPRGTRVCRECHRTYNRAAKGRERASS